MENARKKERGVGYTEEGSRPGPRQTTYRGSERMRQNRKKRGGNERKRMFERENTRRYVCQHRLERPCFRSGWEVLRLCFVASRFKDSGTIYGRGHSRLWDVVFKPSQKRRPVRGIRQKNAREEESHQLKPGYGFVRRRPTGLRQLLIKTLPGGSSSGGMRTLRKKKSRCI